MDKNLELQQDQANQCNNTGPDLHRCGVRYLLKLRHTKGLNWWREYIAKHKLPEQQLIDYKEQWILGNRGEWGLWLSNSSLAQQGQATLL